MDKTKFLVKTAKQLLKKDSSVLHIFRPHRFQLRNALNSLQCWSNAKDDKFFLFNGAYILNKVPREDEIYKMNPLQIVHGMDIFNCTPHKNEVLVIEDMTSSVVNALMTGKNPEHQADLAIQQINLLNGKCNKLVLTSKSFYGMRHILSKLQFSVQDISFDKEWSTICGYTDDELKKQIIPKLQQHPFFYDHNDAHILNVVHQSVGGYNFGNEIIAHPTLTQQFAMDPVIFHAKTPQIFNKTQLQYINTMLNKKRLESIWITIHEDTVLNWSWDDLSSLNWDSKEDTIATKVLFELGLLASTTDQQLQLKFPNMFARRYFDQVLVPLMK